MNSKKMAVNRVDRAVAYFGNNFNCSQAVFTTFATELGVEEELALRIATQFGGGARKGEMCGAVSGALMVLGLKYGHIHAEDKKIINELGLFKTTCPEMVRCAASIVEQMISEIK